MAIRNIRRQATNPLAAPGTPNSAPIYVDSDDNILKMIPAGSGTTEVQILDASSSQTLTSKTLTSPAITGGTVSAATLSANIESDTKVLAASATFTSTTVLTSLTGLTATLVAGKTYQFEVDLRTTQTTNGGLGVAFKYTTATLTSIQLQSVQQSASAVAVANNTTVTDQTLFVNNKTAAYINTVLSGTLVCLAGGTLDVQVAQNTSNSDTTTILLGSFARFTRVN